MPEELAVLQDVVEPDRLISAHAPRQHLALPHGRRERQALKLGEPRDYWLEHKNGTLSLFFTVPFSNPVLTDAKAFSFAVYDPTFFIAFDLAKTDHPVQIADGAPKSCKLKMEQPEQRETAALGPMSQLGGVVSLGRTIAVEC